MERHLKSNFKKYERTTTVCNDCWACACYLPVGRQVLCFVENNLVVTILSFKLTL